VELKVGINGFGRIGRLVLRAGINNPKIELVGINDLVTPNNLAYLLKYDSTPSKLKGKVEAREDGMIIDGHFIPYVSVRNPAELPCGKLGVDYVVECTGLFTDYACWSRKPSENWWEASCNFCTYHGSRQGKNNSDGCKLSVVSSSKGFNCFQY
jgi:glyceraldehyde-3-phosphate dehydrogenase/erythrose-4-phosphate dehydrogenase